MIQSPLKWPGGKSRILRWFQTQPEWHAWVGDEKSISYVEPFCGGASFFFEHFYQHPAWLNDACRPLIQTYQAIRDTPEEVYRHLCQYTDEEEDFLRVRKELNASLQETLFSQAGEDVEVAWRFMVMNRYGFNGLWRMNQKGLCNTPWGRKTVRGTQDLWKRIQSASQKLQHVHLTQGSAWRVLEQIQQTSLVYADPPYLGDSDTEFTSYSVGWKQEDLRQLAEWVGMHPEHKVVISQPDNELTRSIWKHYHWITLEEQRNISCKERGKAKELLVISWLPKGTVLATPHESNSRHAE